MKRARIKNYHIEKALLKSRIFYLICFIGILCTILFARLIYLQVYEHHKFTLKSDKNHYKLEPILPKRGLIYDRNNIVIAENIPAHKLEITPSKSKNLTASLNKLAKLLNIDSDTITQFKKQAEISNPNNPISLKMSLSETEIAKFYLEKYNFPEAQITSYLKRLYPFNDLTTAVLGYVTKLNVAPEDKEENSFYQINPIMGAIGIEKTYEKDLRGDVGYTKIEVDAKGNKYHTEIIKEPGQGANITLSLDIELQRAASNALGTESGAVIALDPQNGEILALVSKPSYDPNLFGRSISARSLAKLNNSEDNPMFNRATKGQFPPASTIKPFISIGALEENIINPEYTIEDEGFYIFPNTINVYHDWAKQGHGYVDMHRAIVISCDTYFYQLAVKMGISNIYNALSQFGFGKKTTPDIDNEALGIIASPEWKLANKNAPWYVGDTIISGIGQGYMLVTPLQLANATAILANKGFLTQSHLVTSITNNNLDHITQKNKVHTANISESSWQIITKAMEGVVSDHEGTGHRFGNNYSYAVAAKTGTAQVIATTNFAKKQTQQKKYKDHTIFIGFSPIQNTKIVVAVVAEHSPIAANVARKVFDAFYHNLQQS
jgi:penicillin-binding protein 2